MDENKDEVIDVVRQLALYLRRNPLACDTAPGIARWWLGDVGRAPQVVEKALSYLVDDGVLDRLPAVDGRQRYRRAEPAPAVDARIDRLVAGKGLLH